MRVWKPTGSRTMSPYSLATLSNMLRGSRANLNETPTSGNPVGPGGTRLAFCGNGMVWVWDTLVLLFAHCCAVNIIEGVVSAVFEKQMKGARKQLTIEISLLSRICGLIQALEV